MGGFSVRPSVRPFVRLAINQRGLTAGQKRLKNNWRGLRAIQRTGGQPEGSEPADSSGRVQSPVE